MCTASKKKVHSTENIGFLDRWGKIAYGVLRWKAIDVTGLEFIIVFYLGLEQFTEPQCCNGTMQLEDVSIEKSRAEEMSEVLGVQNFLCTRRISRKFFWRFWRWGEAKGLYGTTSEARHLRTLLAFSNALFYSYRYVESLFPSIRQPSHKAKEKKQQLKKRFLTITLVLCSVVGSLMFFRSRRGIE